MTTTTEQITRELLLSKYENETLASFIADKLKEDGDYKAAADLDEYIYETISQWDPLFTEDDNWFDEEGGDIKDAIRDEILDILEKE